MNYQEARRLRNLPSLTELMRQKALMGESAGSAIMSSLREKYGISTRMKARAMGIKEKFDPMNIVKFMTGGSRTAAALYGRFAGRSDEDIRYFAGRAQPVDPYTRIGRVRESDDTLPILEKMYGFLSKIYESDLKRKDKEKDFSEEQKAEDEKRHRQLLKALGVKTVVVSKAEKQEDGLFGKIGQMLNSAFASIRKMIDSVVQSILDLKNLLQLGKLMSILSWFGSPVGLALLGITALATLGVFLADLVSNWLTDFVRKQMPDYSLISPIEAKTVLERSSEYDIESFAKKKQFGSREKLEEFVRTKMAEAQYALDNLDLTPKEREEYSKLAEPLRREGPIQQEETITPRDKWPREQGGPAGWDTRFASRYNPDGTLKSLKPGQMPLPPDIRPSEGRSSMQYDDYIRQQTPQGAAFGTYPSAGRRSTPVTSEPPVSDAIQENAQMNADQRMAVSPPVINKAVEAAPRNMVSDALRIMPAVRNLDATFQRMIYNSVRVV
jgi:hypothetical protein